MKVRVYLSDWFFNMGLVGFKRIMDFAGNYGTLEVNDHELKEVENYIEFDTELLRVS